ncbi:hypothetical protein [Sphingomonas paeninsulae]|uniref:hypothetical protein n=1 Tax=Sphingomonas paeninsulae TaxID=2319844 RepID=UPI001EF10BC9|nr:hypothetical protein [Sphingomonas paeninsulae]
MHLRTAVRRPAGTLGATIMLAGGILSVPAAILFGSMWMRPQLGVFFVDLIVLASLLGLALWADRSWSLWAVSAQIIAVITHIVMMIDHTVVPWAYALAQPFWAYPALLALALGTRIHQRRLRGVPSKSVFWRVS